MKKCALFVILSVAITSTSCVRVNPPATAFIPKYGQGFNAVADDQTEINGSANFNRNIVSNAMKKHILPRIQADLERIGDRKSDTTVRVGSINIEVERKTYKSWQRILNGALSLTFVLAPLPDRIGYSYKTTYSVSTDAGAEIYRSTIETKNLASYSGWTFFRISFNKKANLSALKTASLQIADAIARDIVDHQAEIMAVSVASARPIN